MEDFEVPETGAVYTFGKSRFADNRPSHFFIKNDPVIAVACGDEHSVVVCQNGRVFTFGSNEYGQLGLGHNGTVNKPSCVKILKPEKIVRATCGRSHTIVATDTNKIYTFGNNSDGQLGINDTSDKSTPSLVKSIILNENENVSKIAAGSNHSALLTDKGRLFVWGANSEGQLGIKVSNYSEKCLVPNQLPFNEKIVDLSCGYYHTAFITENGEVYTFGENENGKLGYDREEKIVPEPHKLEHEETFSRVFCGGNHSFLISTKNNVYAFGSNLNGQLGCDTIPSFLAKPTKLDSSIFNGEIVTDISCGERHTAFITEPGKLYTCGDSRHGKLCHKNELASLDEITSNKPKLVTHLNGYVTMILSCGGCHTILTAKRSIKSFLDNKPERQNSAPLPPLQYKPIPKMIDYDQGHVKNNIISESSNKYDSENGHNGTIPEDILENNNINKFDMIPDDILQIKGTEIIMKPEGSKLLDQITNEDEIADAIDEEIANLEKQVEEEIANERRKIIEDSNEYVMQEEDNTDNTILEEDAEEMLMDEINDEQEKIDEMVKVTDNKEENEKMKEMDIPIVKKENNHQKEIIKNMEEDEDEVIAVVPKEDIKDKFQNKMAKLWMSFKRKKHSTAGRDVITIDKITENTIKEKFMNGMNASKEIGTPVSNENKELSKACIIL